MVVESEEGDLEDCGEVLGGGRKAVLCNGLFFIWRHVSRGFGFGGCGET